MAAEPHDGTTPLERLEVLAQQEVEVHPGLRHRELYTMGGLLTALWHGDPAAERVLVTCGGAMGGLLGPAEGLFHVLGDALAGDGVGTVRVGYRRPNDLAACIHDVTAAAELAARHGGRRFVVMGHSFGGAVAVRVGALLPDVVAGVVTLSTQSAGCEVDAHLGGRPLLLVHGDADELLPVWASEVVRELAGGGQLEVLPGAGHLLAGAGEDLLPRLRAWILEVLA
jgi:pimeloyl-ACP methyl ester carboxylesterase